MIGASLFASVVTGTQHLPSVTLFNLLDQCVFSRPNTRRCLTVLSYFCSFLDLLSSPLEGYSQASQLFSVGKCVQQEHRQRSCSKGTSTDDPTLEYSLHQRADTRVSPGSDRPLRQPHQNQLNASQCTDQFYSR